MRRSNKTGEKQGSHAACVGGVEARTCMATELVARRASPTRDASEEGWRLDRSLRKNLLSRSSFRCSASCLIAISRQRRYGGPKQDRNFGGEDAGARLQDARLVASSLPFFPITRSSPSTRTSSLFTKPPSPPCPASRTRSRWPTARSCNSVPASTSFPA